MNEYTYIFCHPLMRMTHSSTNFSTQYRIIMAKNGKKNIESIAIMICGEIWIRKCRNKYNNFIYQQ